MSLLRHSYSYYLRLYLFPFFYRLMFRTRARRTAVPRFNTVLFIRPGRLGDMTVATPIFRLLREYRPDVHIAVACAEGSNAIIVQHDQHIDELIQLNFHRIAQVLSLIRLMRRRRFDVVVDLSPGMSSTNLFLLQWGGGRAACLIGCGKELQEPFYDIPLRMGRIHIIDQNISIAETLLGRTVSRPVRPAIGTASQNKIEAQAFWVDHFKDGQRVIGINCSSGSKARQLPREAYARLIGSIAEEGAAHGCAVLLFAVGEQRAWTEAFAVSMKGVHAAPACSVLTAYELIGKLHLLVSPDTSLIHFASAHEVPVAGMFSTHWQCAVRWAPYHVPHRIVLSPDEWGILRIDVDKVAETAGELLSALATSEREGKS